MAVITSEPGTPGRSIYRDILHGSAFYSLPLLVQRITGFALLPLYTRLLAPSDYGTMEMLDQAVGLLTLLLGSSFASALSYFYFQSEAPDWKRRIVSTTILGSLLLGIGCAILGIAGSGLLSGLMFGTPDNAGYFRILFAGVAFSFPLEAVLCWLRTINAAPLYAFASILRLAATMGLIVALMLGAGWRIAAVLTGTAVVTTIFGIVLILLCRRRLGPFQFDPALFRKVFRYSAPMAVTGLALFVLHFGDRFILNSYITIDQLGIYSMAYKVGMLIAFLSSTFNSYWTSQIFGIMKRPDGDEVFARVFTYLNVVMLFAVVCVSVFARPTLRMLATPPFLAAAALAPLIAGAYYVRAMGDFFRNILYVQGRPGLDAVFNWIGATFCLGSYFVLIPRWGAWGAATATFLSFLFLLVLIAAWTFRIRPYRLEIARLSKGLLAAAIPLSISYLVRPEWLASQIGLGLVLALLFPALLVVLRFPTPGEWRRVRELPLRLGWTRMAALRRS